MTEAQACVSCRAVKSKDEFYQDRGKPRSSCKECEKARSAKWRRENRERYLETARRDRRGRWRESHLNEKFGITSEYYEEMLDRQDGVCAICGREDKGRRLAVDHCHDTGRVRGLLCNRCNRAIGLFRESPSIIGNALHYLVGPTDSS